MDAGYILLAIAILVPVVVLALAPHVARRVVESKSQPRVNVQCYQCLESHDSDCAAACSMPA
jgi:hypothetical protein